MELIRRRGAVSHSYTCSDLISIMHRVSALTKCHRPYASICIMYDDGFVGLGVACWPLVPKFAGLRAKKSSTRLPSDGK